MTEYSPYLFNNPNFEVNSDGDVLPDAGFVAPLNRHKARAELLADHPQFSEVEVAIDGISKQLSAKDKVMEGVEPLRERPQFSIHDLPVPPNDGARHAARFPMG